jgi:hypothetical protein
MPDPVHLELAPLPREQTGPFLLLGLDKDASTDEMEAHWAERLKLARRQSLNVPLEDINWARDVLRDSERRLRAEIASLNVALGDGYLAHLVARYSSTSGGIRGQALDREPDLASYEPPVELPSMDEVRRSIEVPAIPEEFPMVREILEELVAEPLDPWSIELPADSGPEGPPS